MMGVNSIILLLWQVVIFPGCRFNVLVAVNLGDDTHSLHLGMQDGAQNIFSPCLLQVQYTPVKPLRR